MPARYKLYLVAQFVGALNPGRGGPLIPVPQTGFPLSRTSLVLLHERKTGEKTQVFFLT